jgi:hypothetical protein
MQRKLLPLHPRSFSAMIFKDHVRFYVESVTRFTVTPQRAFDVALRADTAHAPLTPHALHRRPTCVQRGRRRSPGRGEGKLTLLECCDTS